MHQDQSTSSHRSSRPRDARAALFCTLVLLSGAFLGLASPAGANVMPAEKLGVTEGLPTWQGQFGAAIRMDDGYAVVGAPHHTQTEENWPQSYRVGRAYVFARTASGWELDGTLVPSGGKQENFCGFAVGISGTTAAVGCPYNAGGRAVYIFERVGGSWVETQKITGVHDGFARAVDLDGDTLAVTAHSQLFVYTRSGGTFSLQQHIPSPVHAGALFGDHMGLSGDTIAVGSHGDSERGGAAGAVFVFTRSGTAWTLQQKVMGDDTDDEDRFGTRLELVGDRLVASAASPSDIHSSRGAAYVFDRAGATWQQTAKLAPDDSHNFDQFGIGLAILGENVYVGTHMGDTPHGQDAGVLYEFRVPLHGTPTQLARHYAPDGHVNSWYGWAAAADDRTVMVGAFNQFHEGRYNGAVYVLEADPRPLAFTIPIDVEAAFATERVIFGIANGATEGYDRGLDAFAPPAPPTPSWVRPVFRYGAFDFRVSIDDRDLPASWPLAIQVRHAGASGSAEDVPLTLRWDASMVDAAAGARHHIELVEGDTVVDMATTGAYPIVTSGASVTHLVIRIVERIVPAVSLKVEPVAADFAPGQTRTLDLLVKNAGNGADIIGLDVDAPAGWTATLEETSVALAAGETATVGVDITAPQEGAGEVAFEFRATSDAAPDVFDTAAFVARLAHAYTLDLAAGWHMVSLPLEPSDSAVGAALPGAGTIFAWNGASYVEPTEVHAGVGYWLYVSEATAITVIGQPVESVLHDDLEAGWHMLATPVSPAKATVTGGGVAEDTLYRWDGVRYDPSTIGGPDAALLHPGESYWLYVVESSVDVLVAPLA